MTDKDSLLKLHNCDVRQLANILKREGSIYTEKFIDVTITSPPYFDMISYGYDNQIGYGQKYDEYLQEITQIFKQIFISTKDSGSLWLIVDSFYRDGELVNLPFQISDRIRFCDNKEWLETKGCHNMEKRQNAPLVEKRSTSQYL